VSSHDWREGGREEGNIITGLFRLFSTEIKMGLFLIKMKYCKITKVIVFEDNFKYNFD
jgi:hypothetical protein